MNKILLPAQFLQPPKEHSVSILISSYNTKGSYIQECLESIKHQNGLFNIELIWINDGSDTLNTTLLKRYLDNFKKTTRFTTVIYEENDGNKGIGYTLNKGINMCTNEIIIKMDSDDIMVHDRLQTQIDYMENNPSVMICPLCTVLMLIRIFLLRRCSFVGFLLLIGLCCRFEQMPFYHLWLLPTMMKLLVLNLLH